jgi:hypothetical protein
MQNEAQAKLHVHEKGVGGIISSGVHDLFVHKVYIPQPVLVTNLFSIRACRNSFFLPCSA